MAPVAAGQREILEQTGRPLIDDRPIVATGFVAKRRGQPTFADACRTDENEIVVGVDPLALDQLLESRTVKTAGTTIIDILDAGLLAQFGDAQPRREALVLSQGRLAIEQKPEPFVMAEPAGLLVGGEFGEGLGHAMQAKGVELIEGGMFEQVVSPNCSSAAHGCWRAGSAFRPWRAGARDVGPDCCRGWI